MPSTFSSLRAALVRRSAPRRGVLALILACSSLLAVAVVSAANRTLAATDRLNSAAERLDSLTDGGPSDDARRAAVAWGYAERLRLALESPFRLVESAARDPRLSVDERRTVAEALLARILAGQAAEVDPAALDGIGPAVRRGGAVGEQHLSLITRAVGAGDDPRAGELAVRIAYTLAATERLVEGATPSLVAGVAALVADREIARREARSVLRAAADPVAEVRARRARRAFYAERPTLLASSDRLERAAVEISEWLLDSLRVLAPAVPDDAGTVRDTTDARLARELFEAGRRMPPAAPLAVTVQRYLPLVRHQARGVDVASLARVRNGEMIAAFAARQPGSRAERRIVGRLLVSAAVAMRSHSQDAVWFPGDSAPSRQSLATALNLTAIEFDGDVPAAWRPYFLLQLASAVADLRRVLPTLDLKTVRVRFRMSAPADSALAMHDPRTRTLHLPVLTAGGTLTHEVAHDLDRQSALRQGHPGYRSDYVARNGARERGRGSGSVGASLRALTEETGKAPRAGGGERPAEIFATQVDWFVARALASRGISNGFLTGVQDDLLTGHVVHPERLRASSRPRSLVDALQGMTAVAPFALREREPGVEALIRWALSESVDRDAGAAIVAAATPAWTPPALVAARACEPSDEGAVQLVRMAAESRARGWIRARARWLGDREQRAWARAANGFPPWSAEPLELRVRQLRDHILNALADGPPLSSGIAAHGAPLAARARCS